MKLKLDENLGTRSQQLFRDAGHDIQTVYEEQLQGVSDQRLFEICCTEKRCLVTLDIDFGNTIRFPPQKSCGIVVIRFPRNPTPPTLEELIRRFLRLIAQVPMEKQLWIVEIDRIRIHESERREESSY